MANNEGVDIIIKAQDQYTKTINNITASNELFGNSLKNNEKQLAATEKLMIALRVNGMQPTDAAMIKLKADYDKLSQSLSSGENTLKSSSKQWTSLALVVQDLPYGFRGIQNNLPALFGSIAAAAGPAYFAFSALVAIVTAFEKELSNLFTTVTAADREQKVYNASMEAGQKAYADTKLQVMQLNEQVKEAVGNKDKEKKAVDDYNSSIGVSLGRLNTFKEVQDSLINQGDKYVNFIFKLNMANAAAAKVAEESANMMIASFKDPSKFISGWDKFLSVQFNLFGNLSAAAIGTAEELAKRGKENQQAAIKDAGLNAVAAEKVYNTLKKQLEDAKKDLKFGSFANPKDTQQAQKDLEKANQDRLKAIQAANQAEVKAYTQTLAERDKKEYEAGLKLAENLQTMRNAGYTDSTTYYAAYRAEIDNIATYYNDKELAEAKKVADKVSSIQLDMRFKMQSALAAINEKFATEDIKNNNARLNATLKATRGNYQAQKEAIEQAIAQNEAYRQSAVEAGYGTEEFDKAAANLKAQLEGLVDPLEEFNNSLRNILSTTYADLIAAFGEGFASMFNGGGMEEAMNNFLGILAGGLIQVGKLAIATGLAIEGIKTALKSLNPVLAIAAGIALVGLGSYVKNSLSNTANNIGGPKKFANGGIISGPTMGLMGEYPGAASNPEVVAPLDKLKSLIGGAGGTLEARISGNDLLILMNKAGRNNQNTF
jgi:hypothetical protein